MVLAVFIFFGWQTFKDTRRVTTEGERMVKLLESAHANAEKALAEVTTMKKAIENEIKSAIQPQLAEIAIYVLKSAEFVGRDLAKLSFEDRLSIIDEAAAAITEAKLGPGANSTLSYIWAGVSRLIHQEGHRAT